MISREIKVLNTNGEKIQTHSAVSCCVYDNEKNKRSDLTVVASGENFYVVNNYSYIDGNAYFVGDYIEINRDLFYLMAYSYSYETKQELFGPNMFFYEDMVSEIVNELKPNEERLIRRKNSHNNLSIETIRGEIQNRLLGFDPSIDTGYLKLSLKNIYSDNEKEQLKYLNLLFSIKDKEYESMKKYANLLNFNII